MNSNPTVLKLEVVKIEDILVQVQARLAVGG